MQSPITKKRRNERSRGLSGEQRPQTRPIPIGIVEASASGSVLTVEYNQSVKCDGVPKYTTDVAGAMPVSAVQTSPTTIEITFSASVAAATLINIPYEEQCVRNSSGGFVAPTTFPVGA